MTPLFETILIIGGGLIGSSVARAARKAGSAASIHMSDGSASVCKILTKLEIADRVDADPVTLTEHADLIILATPPGSMGDIAAQIIPSMKPGAILSDVASIKGDIVKAITPHLRPDIHFIPGHPIAGTEHSGPEAGFAELFEDRWCILTPAEETSPGIERLKSFWVTLGSQVAIMSAHRHDIVLATTSHVPHLIAYTLVGTAIDMEAVTRNEVVKFSAGGFRDFTRIAASDPVMWRDVFLQNRESVLEVVDRFIEDLSALKRAIRWEDGDMLLNHFEKTRDIRRRIVSAGQDIDSPNFGRDDSA
jgi:cyclohexadieny/prephenate dehydrogenase